MLASVNGRLTCAYQAAAASPISRDVVLHDLIWVTSYLSTAGPMAMNYHSTGSHVDRLRSSTVKVRYVVRNRGRLSIWEVPRLVLICKTKQWALYKNVPKAAICLEMPHDIDTYIQLLNSSLTCIPQTNNH